MADLAGEVKEQLMALDEGTHRIRIAYIGNVDVEALFVARKVKAITAVVTDQRVDHGDLCTQINQPPRQVGADKTQPASDEHTAVGVIGEMGHFVPCA